jgi:hypothetical protein
MIGNEWTFWEYLFYSFAILAAGFVDLVLDNWLIILLLVLLIVGVRQVWKSLY